MKLKVISVNVWIGGILFDAILEFLRKQDADIVLLQEVYNGDTRFQTPQQQCLTQLKEQLGYEHASFAPAFYEMVDGKQLMQGNAVLSKYPVLQEKIIFYDVPFQERNPDDVTQYHVTPRNLQHVILDCDGTQLHVYNTQGIWGEHGGDTKRRLEMAKTITAALPQDDVPVILAGDFNVDENTQTIALIEEKLLNVFKGELVSSFNLKHKDIKKDPGYATSVVDLFFVSKSVSVLNHFVAQDDVSDHLPLVCEIAI